MAAPSSSDTQRRRARFLTDEEIVAMLEESDAGLSDSEDEEKWASLPLASDVECSGESADEPEPDIAQRPTKKRRRKVSGPRKHFARGTVLTTTTKTMISGSF
ncbi:hypothetical protein MRX96_030161 [Rhipicephalus microplus]